MRSDFYNNFFKTSDNKQISYLTNFPIKKGEKHHNVIVFNYGLVCSYQHWEKQVDFFHQSGYKILLHHYRGHFLSDQVNDLSELTFKTICDDLRNICDYLNIKSVLAVGHSMGVNISLEFAIQNPELTKALILISGTVKPVENVMFDTNLMSFLIPFVEKFKKGAPKLLELLWSSGGHNPLVKRLIHSQGFNSQNVSLEYVEIYLNRVGKLGSDIFLQLFKEMSRHEALGCLHKVEVPCLVMGGESDKVIPNYQQRLLSSLLKNSELYIIKDGSHVPQVDFPNIVNQRMQQFLNDYQIKPSLPFHASIEA